jgi:hypothetical protein
MATMTDPAARGHAGRRTAGPAAAQMVGVTAPRHTARGAGHGLCGAAREDGKEPDEHDTR